MKSIAILGKGASCLKSTKKFVDSHDTVCVINNVIFSEKYDKHISFRANEQFSYGGVIFYTEEILKRIRLNKIIFSGRIRQQIKNIPDYYKKQVKIEYPAPNLREAFMAKHGFNPFSGVLAFDYYIHSKEYDVISLIGFDFYQVGKQPYYYTKEEAKKQLNAFTMSTIYRGYKVNIPSGHNSNKSLSFCHRMMMSNPRIKFNIISNNNLFNSLNAKNVTYISL